MKRSPASVQPSTRDGDGIEVDPGDRLRTNPTIWGLLGLVLVGLGVASLLIVRGVERGPRPPFLVKPPVSAVGQQPRTDPGEVHLAGSGSNLPLTRALAVAFTSAHPRARTVVHASIGSTGGVRAVADGAIDIGLVSRPLTAQEREFGLQRQSYARVAVVFAANPTVPLRDVSHADVLELYSGERQTWSDGRPVVVLQRERGDSSHLAVSKTIDGFADVDAEALSSGRWSVLTNDRAMYDALVSTSGALGLIDQGAASAEELSVRVLSLDGVAPSEQTLATGAYPIAKDLAFVIAGPWDESVEAFLDFVFSPAGEEIIRTHGYLPLPRSGDDE